MYLYFFLLWPLKKKLVKIESNLVNIEFNTAISNILQWLGLRDEAGYIRPENEETRVYMEVLVRSLSKESGSSWSFVAW